MKTVKQIQNEIFTMYYQTPFKGLSKRQFVELGLQNALKFLEINGLPVPNITIHEHSNPKAFCGLCDYSSKRIQVWVPDVAYVSFNPIPGQRRWSYPGYKIDRTGVGVISHEIGHWVDYCVKLHRGFPKKGKITGYEPNIHESVAESMRLFILNPGLLHIIAPERCEYIVKSGLKPVVTEDWDKVLENAPAEYSRQILKNYLGFYC